MKNHYIVLTFLMLFITPNILYAQYGSSIDSINIAQQLYNLLNTNYIVNEIVDVSVAESIGGKFGLISDPYNTLEGDLIFVAERETPTNSDYYGVTGIFKNNQIVWKSDFIKPYGARNGSVLAVFDLNNDGNVDIITTWYNSYGRLGVLDIWIYSWDGILAYTINPFTDFSSGIETYEGMGFDFADYQGDGVWEIIGYEAMGDSIYENSDNSMVYSWDGETYDYSETLIGNPYEIFFPRNQFNAFVTTRVNQNQQNLFNYFYSVKNGQFSAQNINEINIVGNVDSILILNLPSKWKNLDFGTDITFKEDIKFANSNFSIKNKIIAGDEKGFSYSTSGLPYISKAYLRGFNFTSYHIEGELADYLNNSVVVPVVAATLPPDPFVTIYFIDTLINYKTRSFELGWITNETTAIKYDSLFNLTKTQLQQYNNNAAKTILQTVLQEVDVDSTSNLTSEAYALLRYNTEYLLEKIPLSSPNLLVKLTSSLGNQIPASNVMYYESAAGGWKDAVNNGNGTFTVITTRPTVSIRMFYEYANQTVHNVPAQNNTYTFQTVNASVQLKNSSGNLIDQGTVQYYAGAWRSFGTTVNGVANKELLPINYSFRMTYEFGSLDKQQNLSSDPTVVFQTVNAAVELRNSSGNLIDQGTVQYYAGAWRSFGTTVNGVANKELLPINYSFRMIYEYVPLDKQQDISTNSTVTFSTVLCTVKVTKANGQPLSGASTKYYSGAWRDIGLTNANGEAAKELLPKSLNFRAASGNVSKDKQQDIGVNNLVEIQLP